jgi:acetyl-CoA acetyltransferase
LAALKPVFRPDGTITAGNAPGLNSGGAAMVLVAGGMQNMDLAPYLIARGRWGYRVGDGQLYDSMLRDGLNDAFSDEASGWHTEDLVREFQVGREAQDRWALRSQQRFAAAQAAARFEDEIVAVDIAGRKGSTVYRVGPRSATRRLRAAHLRPAGAGVRQGFSRHQNRRRAVAAGVTEPRFREPTTSDLTAVAGALGITATDIPARCDHQRRPRVAHCTARERRCRRIINA